MLRSVLPETKMPVSIIPWRWRATDIVREGQLLASGGRSPIRWGMKSPRNSTERTDGFLACRLPVTLRNLGHPPPPERVHQPFELAAPN